MFTYKDRTGPKKGRLTSDKKSAPPSNGAKRPVKLRHFKKEDVELTSPRLEESEEALHIDEARGFVWSMLNLYQRRAKSESTSRIA